MNSRWSARTCSACKVALSRMRSVTLRPVVSVDRRSMLLDIRPDFPDGSEPNAVGRVIGIVAQCLQRFGVGHLITSLTDLVAHKNQPAPLLRRFLDRFDHLFKAHVVKRRAQCLREITERGIVRLRRDNRGRPKNASQSRVRSFSRSFPFQQTSVRKGRQKFLALFPADG